MLATALLLLAGGWAVAVTVLIVWQAPILLRLWREPVLRRPVLIVESDDWGAGPLTQVDALSRLRELLGRFHDHDGHSPVVTLAVILGVADGPNTARTGTYQRITLCDPGQRPILEALREGAGQGVFALQLHGLEHYWPATLMASDDPEVRAWREAPEPGLTETLPSHLQSRWTDARTLPSRPLPSDEIRRAAAEECDLFERCFGQRPRVAVPTTFVWDDKVEAAWRHCGVRYLVTPGLRNRCRELDGSPGCRDRRYLNGEQRAGLVFLVRDDYFEPERGHSADQALAALDRKTREGRPCLLETHRSNFLGPRAEYAYAELARLYQLALARHPDLCFVSTEALGEALAKRDSDLCHTDFGPRLTAWCERAGRLPRFAALARLSGLLPLLRLLGRGLSQGKSS